MDSTDAFDTEKAETNIQIALVYQFADKGVPLGRILLDPSVKLEPCLVKLLYEDHKYKAEVQRRSMLLERTVRMLNAPVQTIAECKRRFPGLVEQILIPSAQRESVCLKALSF